MSLFKDSMQLINEMAKDKCCSSLTDDDLEVQLTNLKFGEILADMNSIQMGDLTMKAEMVTLRECKRLGCDIVELDELAKYMTRNQINNFKEALTNIAEVNGRDANNIAIVVDEEAVQSAIEEAEYTVKYADDIYKKAKVENIVNSVKVLELLCDNGYKVVKKSE